jgi:ACS family glucarate transporter-like MFS transporter
MHSHQPLSESRATWVRFRVLAFLCSLALLLYIDRVCIGQAEKAIRETLQLSKSDMSWVYNAFIVAYCLFEVPAGYWGDRFGSRGIIARIVIWWSGFTALTGLAFGLWPLVAIRFLFGAGEAGAFPNVARIVSRWFPPAERGLARGAIATTSLIGGAIAPLLAAFLIKQIGWRGTFAVFGAVGVFWAAGFYAWFRDDPSQHPAVNDLECKHIGSVPQPAKSIHSSIPWPIVLTSPNMWLLGSIQTVSASLFYMEFQWYPTYLKEARGLTDERAAWFTSIVISGGAIGCLIGGLFSDWIIRNIQDRKWSRRGFGGGALLLAATFLAGVRYSDNTLVATLCNSAALLCMQLAIPFWWTVVAEISGRHGAAMWGLMNSLGGLGVFTMTILVAHVVEAREAAQLSKIDCWRPVFDGVAVAIMCGAICWLFVDPTRSIVEESHREQQTP